MGWPLEAVRDSANMRRSRGASPEITRAWMLAACASLIGVAACTTGRDPARAADGATSDASPLVDGGGGDGQVRMDGGDAGIGPVACAEGARWVYAATAGGVLLRFRPDERRFERVGALQCSAQRLSATPFSMSVDRNATAWVMYTNGELFRVSTEDASCTAAGFPSGDDVFGMGFVADSEGGDTETLFVAGGQQLGAVTGAPAQLATLDTATLQLGRIGTLSGWPDLTGTGAAQLWGFFALDTPKVVRSIDRVTGAYGRAYDLPGISSEFPESWAFAFWGGNFYLFLKTVTAPSSDVYLLHADTGMLERILTDIGHSVSGAGVSICAPYELI